MGAINASVPTSCGSASAILDIDRQVAATLRDDCLSCEHFGVAAGVQPDSLD